MLQFLACVADSVSGCALFGATQFRSTRLSTAVLVKTTVLQAMSYQLPFFNGKETTTKSRIFKAEVTEVTRFNEEKEKSNHCKKCSDNHCTEKDCQAGTAVSSAFLEALIHIYRN